MSHHPRCRLDRSRSVVVCVVGMHVTCARENYFKLSFFVCFSLSCGGGTALSPTVIHDSIDIKYIRSNQKITFSHPHFFGDFQPITHTHTNKTMNSFETRRGRNIIRTWRTNNFYYCYISTTHTENSLTHTPYTNREKVDSSKEMKKRERKNNTQRQMHTCIAFCATTTTTTTTTTMKNYSKSTIPHHSPTTPPQTENFCLIHGASFIIIFHLIM